MPELNTQFNFEVFAEEMQNRVFVLERTLKDRANQIDELLNKEIHSYNMDVKVPGFTLTTDTGASRTTFNLRGVDPDSERIVPELEVDVAESEGITIPVFTTAASSTDEDGNITVVSDLYANGTTVSSTGSATVRIVQKNVTVASGKWLLATFLNSFFYASIAGSGGSFPVKLTSKTDDTTYVGDLYGDGEDATATETAITIRISGTVASGETVPGVNSTFYPAWQQLWSGNNEWTISPPRAY